MGVEFKFDFPRALAVITYIASKGIPDLTTYKMLKIIFLADKSHLVRYGRTITGDRYSALPDGPVPSHLYNLFKQVVKRPFSEEGRRIVANLEVEKNVKHPRFTAKVGPDINELSRTDIAVLDNAVEKFGDFSFAQLKDLTHEMAAFNRAWKTKKFFANSAPMKFEDFFEDDEAAREETKAEMIDNDRLRKIFAERARI